MSNGAAVYPHREHQAGQGSINIRTDRMSSEVESSSCTSIDCACCSAGFWIQRCARISLGVARFVGFSCRMQPMRSLASSLTSFQSAGT